MILDALVNQLAQRFQHEKRARVCLWFDERREFVRLLPALREHLAAMAPPPFRLLEYDAEQYHGQSLVLITYQAHLATAGRRKLGFRRPRNHVSGRLAARFSVYDELSRTIAFRVRSADELGT